MRTLVTTAVMVPLMTYVLLPRLTRLFAGWLLPHSADESGPLTAKQPL